MISEKEKKILTELRKNSRQSLSGIATKLKVPVTTIFETHHKLKKDVIKKHTSIADFSKAGFPIRVLIAMKKENPEALLRFLLQRDEINNIYRTNEDKILAEAFFPSMKEKHEFLETLQSIKTATKTYDIVEELKKEDMKI
ncbi:MAG: hypothetical protein H8D38_05430 [DPANN group archaeon]|nr:hypothetical protein [DPANN group archaeon]